MADVRGQQVQVKEIGLRTYRSHDLEAMYALDVVCFDPQFRFTRRAMRRFAEAKNARVAITEIDGAIAGFVILHVEKAAEERIGYIVTLDVDPELRRRGIAQTLMREAEQKARMAACVALVLHVFSGNEPAIAFYASLGFTQLHRVRDFYGQGSHAWVYRKLLPSPETYSGDTIH